MAVCAVPVAPIAATAPVLPVGTCWGCKETTTVPSSSPAITAQSERLRWPALGGAGSSAGVRYSLGET